MKCAHTHYIYIYIYVYTYAEPKDPRFGGFRPLNCGSSIQNRDRLFFPGVYTYIYTYHVLMTILYANIDI